MKKNSENFYIGADSGGTKCEILIERVSGEKVNHVFPSIHYSLHGAKSFSEDFNRNLKTFLNQQDIDINKCLGICIGIAGARRRQDKVALKNSLSKYLGIKKIAIETDAMIAIYGAFGNNDGAILIAGTGSVLYAIHDGKLHRIGGWGKILGDQGSGYWIGKEALRHIVREFDIQPEPDSRSLLCKKILSETGLNPSNIIGHTFDWNFPIQEIAMIVLKCAGEKDNTSLKILDSASDDLVKHISDFFESTGRKKPLDLVFVGSLICNDNLYSRKVRKKIKKLFGRKINILKNYNSPAFGGLQLAKKYFNDMNYNEN